MNSTEITHNFKTITVPLIFFDDHESRCCVFYSGEPENYTVKQNKRQITVCLHEDDIQELMSDAEYYGSKRGSERVDMADICRSAVSTVNALMRQGVKRRNLDWRV